MTMVLLHGMSPRIHGAGDAGACEENSGIFEARRDASDFGRETLCMPSVRTCLTDDFVVVQAREHEHPRVEGIQKYSQKQIKFT